MCLNYKKGEKMKNTLKKEMKLASKILKWGGLAIAIILSFVGFGVVNNISEVKNLIGAAVGYFGNDTASMYAMDLIGSFGMLGWLIIGIALVLGGMCYSMSLILKGQIIIGFNSGEKEINITSQPNTVRKIKNIYNATKESIKEEVSKADDQSNDLKI